MSIKKSLERYCASCSHEGPYIQFGLAVQGNTSSPQTAPSVPEIAPNHEISGPQMP